MKKFIGVHFIVGDYWTESVKAEDKVEACDLLKRSDVLDTMVFNEREVMDFINELTKEIDNPISNNQFAEILRWINKTKKRMVKIQEELEELRLSTS